MYCLSCSYIMAHYTPSHTKQVPITFPTPSQHLPTTLFPNHFSEAVQVAQSIVQCDYFSTPQNLPLWEHLLPDVPSPSTLSRLTKPATRLQTTSDKVTRSGVVPMQHPQEEACAVDAVALNVAAAVAKRGNSWGWSRWAWPALVPYQVQ
jgi:hypothetical protein